MKTLMQPYALNTTLTLANRFVMAPLTRCMADQNLVPTQQIADYYARRADVGLLISEGVIIRPDAQGYP
ncbi:MAG: alkene reductase, partial [Plesiomonas sp.]